jgi:hypothetical protein
LSSDTITIASRKLAEHKITPILVEIEDAIWVDMGTGMLADILAANVESGAIPGKILRDGDTVYYFNQDGYDHLMIIIMIQPQ